MTICTKYQIRVKGHVDNEWRDWFEQLEIRHEPNGESLLTLLMLDQAALHGILNRVRDLGLPLISVNRIEG